MGIRGVNPSVSMSQYGQGSVLSAAAVQGSEQDGDVACNKQECYIKHVGIELGKFIEANILHL